MPLTCKPGLMLAAAALALAPVVASTAAAGTLQGQVLAPDGSPLAGIRIQVTSAAAAVTAGTRTGADGAYLLAGLPPGIDYVIVVAAGSDRFAPMIQDRVVIGRHGPVQESFQLFPSILELIRVRARQEGPVVSLVEVGTRTRYTGEFLAGLPVTCRN